MSARLELGTVDIARALLSARDIEADRDALAVPNPARVSAVRQGDRSAWRLPETLSTLIVGEATVHYPIGAPQVYRPRIRALGLDVIDARPMHVAEPLIYRGMLTAYQHACVDALARVTCGVAVAPCGAGKGEVVAALTGRLGLPTLIVVGQREHAHDLRDRIHARLGVEAGMIGDGVFDLRRITVALVQSLAEATLPELAPHFGAVLVDECHHAAADSYRAVLSALPARRRFGFTATIDRTDGLRPHVHHVLGPVVHQTTRADLVQAGRAVTPSYVTVPTEYAREYHGPADWAPLLAALELDADRDAVIIGAVERYCAGELSAVLVGRVAHAERLAERLCARGLRAHALHGQLKRARRAAVLAATQTGACDVIVGTQILDEGIDLPRLSRVVLAWPARSEGRIVQRIGRALRVHEGKASPLVIDIVDERVGVLAHQARQRRRIVERLIGEAAIGRAA